MNKRKSAYKFFINSLNNIELETLKLEKLEKFDLEFILNNSLITLCIKSLGEEDFNYLIEDLYKKYEHQEEKEATIYFSFHKMFRQIDVTDSFPNIRVFSFSYNTLDKKQKESFRTLNGVFDSIMWSALSKDNSFFEILKKFINELEEKNETLS